MHVALFCLRKENHVVDLDEVQHLTNTSNIIVCSVSLFAQPSLLAVVPVYQGLFLCLDILCPLHQTVRESTQQCLCAP